MPSGYTAALPDTVVLDAGVLSIDGSTLFATRGGLRISNAEEWRNLDFDGKRSPIAGLDRKVANVLTISGRMIQINKRLLSVLLNHGGIAGLASLTVAEAAALSVAAMATYSAYGDGVPINASQMTAGLSQQLKNVLVTWQRGNGGTFYVKTPYALVTSWSFAGGSKDAAEYDFTMETRQDLTSSTDTDVTPWSHNITP